MKIYVISLKNQEVRRKQISNQLEKLDLSFEFFDSINPKENMDMIEDAFDSARAIKTLGRELSKVEVACALSHREVAKKFLQTNEEVCLVLEDDAEVEDKLVDIIKYIENLKLKSFDVILLGYCKLQKSSYEKFYKREPLYKIKYEVNDYKIGKVGKNWTSGLVGYFLTRNSAKLAQAYFKKIYTVADQWDVFERDYGLNIYHCRPLIVHEQFEKLESSLEKDRANKILRTKPSIKEYFYVTIKIILIELKLYFPACRLYLKITKKNE